MLTYLRESREQSKTNSPVSVAAMPTRAAWGAPSGPRVATTASPRDLTKPTSSARSMFVDDTQGHRRWTSRGGQMSRSSALAARRDQELGGLVGINDVVLPIAHALPRRGSVPAWTNKVAELPGVLHF